MAVQLNNIQSVGFDLDGTLVDSRADILAALRSTLLRNGQDSKIADRIQVGAPFRQMIGPFFEGQDQIIEKLHDDFRAVYDSSVFPNTTLYAGALELLSELCDANIPIWIATNKPLLATTRVLTALNIQKYFSKIFCPDINSARRYNKREMIALSLEQCVCRLPSVYIGDTADDIHAARSNGLMSIGASYGYSEPAVLEFAKPDQLVANPPAILTALQLLDGPVAALGT